MQKLFLLLIYTLVRILFVELEMVGSWYHYKGKVKKAGCDFLSNAIMSLRNNLLNLSEDYGTYKYSIDRVYEILKN